MALELKRSAEMIGDSRVLRLVEPYLNNFSGDDFLGDFWSIPEAAEKCFENEHLPEYDAILRIATYKRKLDIFPDDSVTWINLGLCYLEMGSYKKANVACLIACKLSPNNSFVIRSSTRCFAHTGRIDYALSVFSKCNRLKTEPWLLSAQISLYMIADKPQNLISEARGILSSRKFSDFHLNELRAALGTLEEQSGSHSKAKKLFKNALLAPTENTLSQVLKMGMVSIIPDFLIDNPPPKSFEAMARLAFRNGDWEGALAASNAWLQDEAYSGRPAKSSAPYFSNRKWRSSDGSESSK